MKLKLFILFIIIQFILLITIKYMYDFRKNLILDSSLNQLQLNYKSLIKNYDTLALTVFNGFLNKDDLKEALSFQEKDDLYNIIKKKEAFLDSINFNDIHFHTPDNKSFVFLKNTDSTGFDLSKFRYSITYVNKYKKEISGFEAGRRTLSYRYVYPMFTKDNEHIGSVENSLHMRAFIKQFESVYNINMNLIVSKDKLDEKLIKKDLKKSYLDSFESKDYYLYKFGTHFIDNDNYILNLSSNMNLYKTLNNKLKKKKLFNLEFENNAIATYLPINNIQKEHLGYFIFYMKSNELKTLKESLIYVIVSLELVILLLIYVLYRILSQKDLLEKEVVNKTIELVNVNNNLEKSIIEEVEKSRKKDFQLMETAKMAQMGEMIGNIAHQWRQPLSAISTMSTGMIINKQIGNLSDEKLISNLENINKKSLYLSEIINTFINFFKDEKELKTQSLYEIIIDALSIIEATLKHNGIQIINNIKKDDDVELYIVTGELPEVIINILSNAKDAILDNNIENPLIELNLEVNKDKLIITIQDNAGGISEDIIDKIFDPYFTTKHQSQGTGLGLHMSRRIINESLKGNLYVKNNNGGAKFYIELPI